MLSRRSLLTGAAAAVVAPVAGSILAPTTPVVVGTDFGTVPPTLSFVGIDYGYEDSMGLWRSGYASHEEASVAARMYTPSLARAFKTAAVQSIPLRIPNDDMASVAIEALMNQEHLVEATINHLVCHNVDPEQEFESACSSADRTAFSVEINTIVANAMERVALPAKWVAIVRQGDFPDEMTKMDFDCDAMFETLSKDPLLDAEITQALTRWVELHDLAMHLNGVDLADVRDHPAPSAAPGATCTAA